MLLTLPAPANASATPNSAYSDNSENSRWGFDCRFDYPNNLLEQPTLAARSGHVPLVEDVTCLAFPSLKSSEELFLLYRLFCLEIPFYPSYSSV